MTKEPENVLIQNRITATRGIAFSPTRGLHLSDDLSLNYLVAATA